MMRNVGGKMVRIVLFAWAALLFAGMDSAFAQQSVAGKLWYANWECRATSGRDTDLGDALMYMAQYNYTMPDMPVSFSAQFGMGNGWGDDAADESRMDGLVSAAYRYQWVYGGLGYHYMGQTEDGKEVDWEWRGTYHGPELLAGAVLPLYDEVTVGLTAAYIPILFWSATDKMDGESQDSSGQTTSYTYDVSLGYRYAPWWFSAGYRGQHIQQDLEADPDGGIASDDFKGPYAAVAYAW